MTQHEIAELVKDTSIYELAAKTVRKVNLTDNEKAVAEQLDEWARKIGETGHDRDHEIAAFITRTINDEFYDAPNELLDAMFDRGSIGEFDDYEGLVMPIRNTLQSHLSAAGGNVEKSYLDFTRLKPVWKNRQVETQVSYRDIRSQGWKSIALLADYAVRALENALFYDIFSVVDAAIATGAENCITETGTLPTQATMDALALYLNDRSNDSTVVALSKYIQAASKLQGFHSEEMLNEIHRTGRMGMYDGISMHPISAAKRQGDGSLLIPD